MEKKAKLLKDVKAGDTIYYLPKCKILGTYAAPSEETVEKVTTEVRDGSTIVNIFIDGCPEISCSIKELQCETISGDFGYYSTESESVRKLLIECIKTDVRRYHKNGIGEVMFLNEKIEDLYKKFSADTGLDKNAADEDKLVVVPKSLIKNVLAYCEKHSICNELSDYDDFYHELKRKL